MSELIPDEYAQILWDDNEEGKIKSICVLDFRDKKLQDRMAGRYDNSQGADGNQWLTHIHPIANVAGVFAHLAFQCGFVSPWVATECLREFARIESAEWARKMLAVMEHVR